MILDTIVEKKQEEVKILKTTGIQLPPGFEDANIDAPRGFRNALVEKQGVAIIAEAKKASPSKGVICEDFNPIEIAQQYQRKGAQAISVLTDVDFFQGSLLYLLQVRENVTLPVIRKDFIIDSLQIEEAHRHGADAILLIAAILDKIQLKDFRDHAREFDMDILVEVHDEEELDKVLQVGFDLIGINNRNLKDFSMDIGTTFRLQKYIPKEIPVVSESGLKSLDDIMQLEASGVCAALIGESLMRAGAKGSLLQEMSEAQQR